MVFFKRNFLFYYQLRFNTDSQCIYNNSKKSDEQVVKFAYVQNFDGKKHAH